MKKKFLFLAVMFLMTTLVIGCSNNINKEKPLPEEKQDKVIDISGDMKLEVTDNMVVAKLNSNAPDGGNFELIINYNSDMGTEVENETVMIKGSEIVREFVVPDFIGYISGLAILDFNLEAQPEKIRELGIDRENLNIVSNEVPYPNLGAIKKMVFANWESHYNQQSEMLDDALVTWQNIMQGLANGSIGEYDAYDKLQSLEKQLNNIFSRDFTDDVWAISELSKEQRSCLKDAFNDMFTAVHFRQKAVRMALNWLDDPTFSNAQKIKDNIGLADSCIFDSISKVTKVKQELGLIE